MSVKVQSPQQLTQKNFVGIVLCYNHIVEYCMELGNPLCEKAQSQVIMDIS